MTSQHSQHPQQRQGFTLVELTLSIVVGSMIMLGVAGVFAATRNMDRIFGSQYIHSTQLHITQLTIRKTLLSLHIKEDQRANNRVPNGSKTSTNTPKESEFNRPRIILETDPAYASIPGPWQPQRFEVVVSTPPIALNMATKAAAWARINDRDPDSLDFSSADASGGVMRSVFELRPDGAREYVLRNVGLMDPDPKADQKYNQQNHLNQSNQTPSQQGWTLWWRPILYTESLHLNNDGQPLADNSGTRQEIRQRLAGAIPLVQGIDVCAWTIYKSDLKVTDYEALSMSDLPAYAEFELLLLNGQYATWMFEVDWVLGEDPLQGGEENNTNNSNSGNGSNRDDPTVPANPADPSNPGGTNPNPNNPTPPRGGDIQPDDRFNGNLGGGDT